MGVLERNQANRIVNTIHSTNTSNGPEPIDIDGVNRRKISSERDLSDHSDHPDDSSMSSIPVRWPHGQTTVETVGEDWLKAASNADVSIPTGCLGGSCGACEIEVNGKMVRACISTVPPSKSGELVVTFATDPYW